MPVGVGILLGTLLAFMTQPIFERLRPRLGATWSALATVAASTVLFAGVLGGLTWLFVEKGTTLAKSLIEALNPGGAGGGLLDVIGKWTSRIGIPPEEIATRARAYAETALVRAESVAELLVSTIATALLGLFFMMLSMHFMLRNWNTVTRQAEATFPLRPEYTAALFVEFRRVGRTTLLGTIVTGIAQGILATIGFWITGVPEPIFFGAATAVASLIPAIGTMLVWVPAGIGLMLTGHPTKGIVELVWGALIVVGLSDYVIRPRLVSGEGEVPSLVTFAALFGGVEVFGLKGLIVGPVLMSLALAVLRLYANETRKRRALIRA
jgi:predicted PurR-regulated permease PerM